MEKENEFKLMLVENEYNYLMSIFRSIVVKSGLQTNYYYDTMDGLLRKENVTVRVRQTADKLEGTVKRHLSAMGDSTEDHFPVSKVPQAIMLDHYPVWIRGALHTRRTVFRVCEGITMMLDKNTYLDVIDYELEVEFSLPYRKQAEGVVQLVLSLLHRARVIQPVSKSERFFRRMDELHTRAKKAKK